MTDLSAFKPGNLVVRYGKILKVIKLTQDCLVLRPYFNQQNSHHLTYTVKLQMSSDSFIRPLCSKSQLAKIMDNLMAKTGERIAGRWQRIQDNPKTNSLKDSLFTIRALWLEEQANNHYLPGGKKNIFQACLDQAAQEIAAINRTQIETAKQYILKIIKSKK